MRTCSSFNHSGPDEVLIAILLQRSALKGFDGYRSDQSAAQLGWPPGLGHSSRNVPRIQHRANTRMGGAKRYPSMAVCKRDGFREEFNPSYCPTDLPDGRDARIPVKPRSQKYFCFSED